MSLVSLRPAALAAALCLAGIPGTLLAQTAPVRAYAIPGGDLGTVLNRIARESGQALVADPALVRGKTAPAVDGRFTAEEAARQALQGSGLELVPSGQGWTLRAASTPGDGAAMPMPSANGPAVGLRPIVVSGSREPPAYIADRPTSIATKTDLLPRLTPFSIDQVTSEMIQERGDANIFATLEGFAGLTTNSSNSDAGGGHSRAIQIRGFANGQTLINGIPSYSDTAGTLRSTDSLESVELLRGPAGLYYGSAEPGGVISYQYKRPRPVRATVLRLDTDGHGSWGGMLDTTGPIDAERTWMYRLVGSLKHREDDQDHIWSEPRSLLAALTWRPGSSFNSTLTYERLEVKSVPEQENNFRIASGPLAGQYYPVSKDFYWGSLNDRVVRDTDTVIWDATWSETEALKVRGGLNYQEWSQYWQNTRVRNASEGPDADGNVARYVSGRQSEGDSLAGSLDVSGVWRAAGWRHDWLVGAGYGRSRSSSSGRQVAGESISGTGAYPVDYLNIDDPDYTDYLYPERIRADPLVPSAKRTDKNLYLQDMLHLPNGSTRFMIGVGWSQYESRPAEGDRTKVQQWSPRVAVMQDFGDHTTVYASYGESFLPQSSLTLLDTRGSYLTDPVEGLQYEIGVKHDLFDGAAMATAALFRVDKKNVATALENLACTPGQPAVPVDGVPDDAAECYSLAGLTRAQGVELRLSGEVADGWIMQFGYSYTDTEYVRSASPAAQGRSVEYTPRHNLSFWNKLRLHRSLALGEFSAGLGIKAWSEVHGPWSGTADDAQTNRSGGYGLVDLGGYWDHGLPGGQRVKLSLLVSNLFDREYYERRRFPPGTVLYGDERRVSLSAQLSF